MAKPPDSSKGREQQSMNGGQPAAEVQARQRILDAAQRLFALQGFDVTSTKAIAQEAGVPAGIVFYYFASKQKLLEDLVEERSFLPELEQILRSAPVMQPRDALFELGRRFLAVVTRREAIARILVRESPSHPAVAERWRQMRESAIAIIAKYLEDAVARGSLRTARPARMARIFLYNLIFSALIDEASEPEVYLAEAVDTLLEGILPA